MTKKGQHNFSTKPDNLDAVRKLYLQGLSDNEIAERLGTSRTIVVKCRLKRGLRRIKNNASY